MIAPYTCPTCRGQGTVTKPSWLGGDKSTWVTFGTGELFPCPSCNGCGIVWNEMNEILNYKEVIL